MKIDVKAVLVEVPWANMSLGEVMANSDCLTFYLLTHHGTFTAPPDGTELVLELRKVGQPPEEFLMGTSDGGKTLFPVLACLREGVEVKILDPQGVLQRLPW